MPNLPLGFRRILCRNKIDKADVHAFALRPTVELMKQLSTYTEVAVVAQLRPPCDYSCQGLIYQMYNTNDWQSMFGYQTIISRRGGGAAGPKGGGGVSANAKTASSTGPGTKSGAASSKAGKSEAEFGFQASTFKARRCQFTDEGSDRPILVDQKW